MHSEESRTKFVGSSYPYPACWQDDARVQVLLAPFRNRNVNPENYDSKMKFWQDTIKEYCLFKGKVNFCKRELQHNFTKGQRVPSCFETVLGEMQKKNLIRLSKDYEYDPVNCWSGWAVNTFFKSIHWGFDKIKSKFGAGDTTHLDLVEFIHLEVIKKYCSELEELLFQPPFLGGIHHIDVLRKELCTALNVSEESLRVCLHTLNVQRKIGLEYKTNSNEIHLVKVPAKEENDANITEADHAIHNLQVTKTNLENQLENIDVEIKNNENKARQYIKENKRLLAKTLLRKKHLLEKNQERRILALHNIETLLSNVNEAKLNGVILDTYKFGTKALQNVLAVSNLKYDNVDEIVADVQETMDSFREVQDNMANVKINESLGSLADEDELERELKEIMGESLTTDPIKDQCNNIKISMPEKVEIISDLELSDMLKGLEIEQTSPANDITKNLLSS